MNPNQSSTDTDRLESQLRMLAAITEAQALFIEDQSQRKAFEVLLGAFLNITGSELGFLGEVAFDVQGQLYLRPHAVTNLAWDAWSLRLCDVSRDHGVVFDHLDSLFRHCLGTGEVVISDDPDNDPRAGHMPCGHQGMRSFLGIPLAVNGTPVAMVGLANSPLGYSDFRISLLEPLLCAVRQLVVAWRGHQERVRTSRALEAVSTQLASKSEALQVTLDSITQGLAKIDPDGHIRVYNRRFLEILDLPEEIMLRTPHHTDIVRFQTERGDFGPNRAWVDAKARPFITDNPTVAAPASFTRRTRDGRTLEVNTFVFPEGGMVRTYTDVTNYIQAQEALSEERQRLAWVLDATRPGIWETNLTDGTVIVNERWAGMLGYTRAEIEPVTVEVWRSMVHPDDLPSALLIRAQHLAGELPYYECDLRMRHKDGRWVWINSRGRVHRRDEQYKAMYMSGTHLDISDRMAAQEQIRALNISLEQRVRKRTAELERSMRAMEVISTSMAHDLRGPLRVVNGFAEVIAEEEAEKLSESGRQMFQRIARSSRNMDQMITDMLELLHVAQVDLVVKPVSMVELTHAVIRTRLTVVSGARLEVLSMPDVLGDESLIALLLENLIDNALKYSKPNVQSVVEVGFDALKGAYFVRDNGVGFDMSRSGELFGLFQRLDEHMNVPGTGVGLAVVARIIERHSGSIHADSAPGCGATFWFTLPYA